MPLKKIAVFTILLLIPSFVYFVMCPVAHAFTASKCQQLLIAPQPFQKNALQQKESTSAPLGDSSFFSFNLHAPDKAVVQFLQPSLDKMPSNQLTQLKTTRINI